MLKGNVIGATTPPKSEIRRSRRWANEVFPALVRRIDVHSEEVTKLFYCEQCEVSLSEEDKRELGVTEAFHSVAVCIGY